MSPKKQPTTIVKKIPYWGWGLILTAIFFALYAITMPLTNAGYADSDELITVAYHAGVAHPPGYPLYILLLNIFMGIPTGLNPAGTAHLLSVIFSTLGLFLTYLSAINLYRLIKFNKKEFVLISSSFEQVGLAILTATSLGLSFLYWTYGHIAEKLSLSALFVAVILYIYTLIFAKDSSVKRKKISWLTLWLLTGLAINHHQPLILLLVPNLMLLLFARKNQLFSALLSALALLVVGFMASVLILWQLNQTNALVSWNFDSTFTGLLNHITRQDFSGEIYSQGKTVQAYFGGLNFSESISSLSSYFLITFQQWGWWVILIGFLSLRFGAKHVKKPFLVLFVAYVLLGPFLAAYLRYPQDWGSQAIAQRQFLPSFVILPLLLYFGWFDYIKRLGRSLAIIVKPKIVTLIIIAIPVMIFSYRLIKLFPVANLHEYDHVSKQYQSVVSEVKPNSIITCYSDISCFALLYERYVAQDRKDVEIIPLAHPLIQNRLDASKLQGFSYTDNPFLLLDIISWNLDKRPVYAVDINDYFYNFLGLEYPYMYYVPQGYYGELSRNLPEQIPQYDSSLTDKWLQTKTFPLDPMRIFHKTMIGRSHTINGKMLLLADQRNIALEEFNRATDIFFQLSDRDKEQITQLRNGIEQAQASPDFKLGGQVRSAQDYLDFLPDLIEQNMLNRAYRAALAAVISEPNNPLARLTLARLYQEIGDNNFAKLEYFHTLMIDPGNSEAKDALSELGQ